MPRFYGRLPSPFIRNGHQNPAVSVESTSENSYISVPGNTEQGHQLLVSGEVTLKVHEEPVYMASLGAELNLHIVNKRPFKSHCNTCQSSNSQLISCQLLTQPTTLTQGKHTFPFSALVEGQHPASMQHPLLSVKYDITVEAQYARQSAASLETTKDERTITVRPAPTAPRTLLRAVTTVDPIKIIAHYSPVICAESPNRFIFELEGLNAIGETQSWKLNQISWHLIETAQISGRACKKHCLVVNSSGDMGRAMRITDTRVLAKSQLQDGWSSDPSGSDARVNMDLEYMVQPQRDGLGYVYDTKWPGGFEITHRVVVWFSLSREQPSQSKAGSKSLAGHERIVRVSYDVVLTDCGGKDADWDADVPPTYGEVGGGPPGYHGVEVAIGEEGIHEWDVVD